jgi:hypothetical protein
MGEVGLMRPVYPRQHEDLGLTTIADDIYRLDDAVVYTVASDSNERGRYRVMEWQGKWDCTCRGFAVHRHCKHITRVREAIG